MNNERVFVEGVIFDFDGVLINTDQCHKAAWKSIADKLHIWLEEKVYDDLRGIARQKCLDIILHQGKRHVSKENQVLLLQEKNQIYLDLVQELDFTVYVRKIQEITDELHNRGIKVAVASSSKNARAILKQMRVIHKFDVVIDGNDTTTSKPDPDVFLKASNAIGVAASKCIVVEDSRMGLEAARRAGMRCVSVNEVDCGSMHVEDILDILHIVYREKDGM